MSKLVQRVHNTIPKKELLLYAGESLSVLSGINVQTHNNYIMLQFNTVCADPYNMIMLLV